MAAYAGYVVKGNYHPTPDDYYYQHLVIHLNNLTDVGCKISHDAFPEGWSRHGIIAEGDIPRMMPANYDVKFEITPGSLGHYFHPQDITVKIACKNLGWIKLRTWKESFLSHATGNNKPKGVVVGKSANGQLYAHVHSARVGTFYLSKTKGVIYCDISDNPHDFD